MALAAVQVRRAGTGPGALGDAGVPRCRGSGAACRRGTGIAQVSGRSGRTRSCERSPSQPRSRARSMIHRPSAETKLRTMPWSRRLDGGGDAAALARRPRQPERRRLPPRRSSWAGPSSATRSTTTGCSSCSKPWRGHRQRVVRLIELVGTLPRFAPRIDRAGPPRALRSPRVGTLALREQAAADPVVDAPLAAPVEALDPRGRRARDARAPDRHRHPAPHEQRRVPVGGRPRAVRPAHPVGRVEGVPRARLVPGRLERDDQLPQVARPRRASTSCRPGWRASTSDPSTSSSGSWSTATSTRGCSCAGASSSATAAW